MFPKVSLAVHYVLNRIEETFQGYKSFIIFLIFLKNIYLIQLSTPQRNFIHNKFYLP